MVNQTCKTSSEKMHIYVCFQPLLLMRTLGVSSARNVASGAKFKVSYRNAITSAKDKWFCLVIVSHLLLHYYVLLVLSRGMMSFPHPTQHTFSYAHSPFLTFFQFNETLKRCFSCMTSKCHPLIFFPWTFLTLQLEFHCNRKL